MAKLEWRMFLQKPPSSQPPGPGSRGGPILAQKGGEKNA